MRARVEGKYFIVRFQKKWLLPSKQDKDGIHDVLNKVLAYGKEHGATRGQLNAIRKGLTSVRFWLRANC